MLEAKLVEAGLLKKLLDAVKELVTDANFECNEEGINLQAMDNSHVALVAVQLQAGEFENYRCDRPMPLGVNLGSLFKVLKCAKDDDICTLKALDDADTLNLIYEAKHSDRVAEYDMKLMDIDIDALGIPDTEYEARITMPSSEFARLVRDLASLGESVRIDVSKEGVRFACDGEAANANILLRQSDDSGPIRKVKKSGDGEPSSSKKVKKEDADVEMEDEEEEERPAASDGEEEQEREDEDDGEETGQKRKKKANGTKKPAKKAKTAKSKKKNDNNNDDDDDEDEDGAGVSGVVIELNSHVSLTFSLKYLVNFAKSSNICNKVQLMLSNDVPLLVSYDFKQGHIRYYLAPKIGDE